MILCSHVTKYSSSKGKKMLSLRRSTLGSNRVVCIYFTFVCRANRQTDFKLDAFTERLKTSRLVKLHACSPTYIKYNVIMLAFLDLKIGRCLSFRILNETIDDRDDSGGIVALVGISLSTGIAFTDKNKHIVYLSAWI